MASSRDSDSKFLKNFWISNRVLVPDSEFQNSEIDDDDDDDGPKCPVLVFVNSRSGGQLGGDLLKTYRALLNEKQVLLHSRNFDFVILSAALIRVCGVSFFFFLFRFLIWGKRILTRR